jgi:hypothetical protein
MKRGTCENAAADVFDFYLNDGLPVVGSRRANFGLYRDSEEVGAGEGSSTMCTVDTQETGSNRSNPFTSGQSRYRISRPSALTIITASVAWSSFALCRCSMPPTRLSPWVAADSRGEPRQDADTSRYSPKHIVTVKQCAVICVSSDRSTLSPAGRQATDRPMVCLLSLLECPTHCPSVSMDVVEVSDAEVLAGTSPGCGPSVAIVQRRTRTIIAR